MTSIIVASSTVTDGSMYNRDDLDDPAIIENREKFLSTHNITLDQTSRLHVGVAKRAKEQGETDWCRYLLVQDDLKGDGMRTKGKLTGDALVTTDLNHALILPVADCIGLALYDPEHHVMMVSHLGRHSIEQQGGTKSVQYLVEKFGSDPAQLKLWATASAGKDKYPLWNLDNKSLKEALFEQLSAAGVEKSQVIDDPNETTKDDRYFSFSEFHKGNRTIDGDHAIVAMMT